MDGFSRVGNTSILASGQMRLVRTPQGKRLLANFRGKYYALAPECTHQGCSLVDGKLDGTTVSCFCHFAEFDITSGTVLIGPAEVPLGTYEVRIEDGEVWVANAMNPLAPTEPAA